MDVEPVRSVPVRLRFGSRTRTLAINGLQPDPHLNRVADRTGQTMTLPEQGLVVSKMLGEILGVKPGDLVQVEVLEGRRPNLDIPVIALIDDTMGLQAYMRIDAVRAMMREGRVVSGAYLTLDPAARARFYRDVKVMPGGGRRRAP